MKHGSAHSLPTLYFCGFHLQHQDSLQWRLCSPAWNPTSQGPLWRESSVTLGLGPIFHHDITPASLPAVLELMHPSPAWPTPPTRTPNPFLCSHARCSARQNFFWGGGLGSARVFVLRLGTCFYQANAEPLLFANLRSKHQLPGS